MKAKFYCPFSMDSRDATKPYETAWVGAKLDREDSPAWWVDEPAAVWHSLDDILRWIGTDWMLPAILEQPAAMHYGKLVFEDGTVLPLAMLL